MDGGWARMKIVVHAVGRMKAGPERELADRYFDRFAKAGGALGLDFGGVTESPESRASSDEERKRDESGRLLASLDAKAVLFLLDGRGRNLSSGDFARRLASARDGGARQLVLAIGGADGHGEAARVRADMLWSFGAVTWPHQLVRVMLAEQLYRASTILSGHPYHRA